MLKNSPGLDGFQPSLGLGPELNAFAPLRVVDHGVNGEEHHVLVTTRILSSAHIEALNTTWEGVYSHRQGKAPASHRTIEKRTWPDRLQPD